MTALTNADILAVSEELSYTKHESSLLATEEVAFCASVAAEEASLEIDRRRYAIAFGDDANYYELTAAGSAVFSATLGAVRTVHEAFIQAVKPKSALIIGFPWGAVRMLASTDGCQIDVANSIHLDYFERFGGAEGFDYSVVTMQNLRGGALPRQYDVIYAQMSWVAGDDDLLEHLYAGLSPKGVLLLNSSHDQGAVFIHGAAHPYAETFTKLSQFEGANVYQIPVGIGATVVTKA